MALVVAGVARAESTSVQIKNVHLCCQSCVKGVDSAVSKVKDVTVSTDKDAGIVSLTGPDTASVQKAADALVAAGYYGESDNSKIKLHDKTGAKDKKVQMLKVEDVHLCCGKCVTAVQHALEKVPGVTGNTAEKNAKSFNVTGDFNEKDVFTQLQKAGLTGQVAK